MNILDQIVAHKQREIIQQKEEIPLSELKKSPFFQKKCISLKESLIQGTHSGIIAEFKTKSPSKGIIKAIPEGKNRLDYVKEVTGGYARGGASAISVLTDQHFFAGSNEDLQAARKAVNIPILRKDFILQEYQIVEAKALGADLVLLIAACLEPDELVDLARFAKSLGLEVLMEVHNEEELNINLNQFVDLIGVNNRNLKNFQVDIETSLKLSELIPNSFVKISESGISKTETIHQLQAAGFKGFLMGENFMKTEDPAKACANFIQELTTLNTQDI